MAYLVFSSHKGQEIGRRRLDGPVTIGRSPDCDVSLHDILLSRRHCRFERTRRGWMISDLKSKNGTVIDGRSVERHLLRPGEVVKIGRVNVTFRAGKLAREEERTERLAVPRDKRPAKPFDASSGTVSGFRYEPPAGERSFERFPTPKPVLTDSGKFVLDDSQLGPAAIERPERVPSPEPAQVTAATMTAVPRSARPKTPTGDAVTPSPAAPPVSLLDPPRAPVGLRLRGFLRSLQRGLKRPLARWAALLVGLGGVGAAALLST